MKTLSAEPFLLLLTIYLHKWLNVIAKERGREKNRREKILKQRLFTNCIVWRKDCSLALLLVIRFGPRPWDSPGKTTGVSCHFLLRCMKVKSESEVAQSCPTLSDPMDCSLPGSSVHWIFQVRVLEWGAIAFSVLRATTSVFFKRDQEGCKEKERRDRRNAKGFIMALP